MPCVHYKFSSKLSYSTVTFEGLHISLWYLKKEIMGREKLKAANSDLQITNAQTKEEYTDDNALIPKNSSVIVRRIPARGGKSTSKRYVTTGTGPAMGTTKAIDDSSASISLNQLTKTANLAEADASEEDKIKAMVLQSGHEYNPANYTKNTLVGLPPPSYACFRCGKPGHYIRDCPTNGDKNSDSGPRIKKSTGIPRSFMMEVKDPTMKGAMLTNTGKYAIPIIDAEAYATGKKEKPPFLPEGPSASSEEEEEENRIPEELLCLICKDTMTDAAIIPCCGNSYCDECIRTALLESEQHTCPTCHQNDVSPDSLVANKVLRQAVDNFTNKTGYTQRVQKQLPPPAPRITPPSSLIQQNLQPLMRPPISRQQDPLRIPVISSSAHPTPSPSSLTPNPSSSAPPVSGNPSSVPVPDTTARGSLSVHSEKSDGPFRDSDDKVLPAAALPSEHSKGTSSIAITALKDAEGNQVPVLGTPSLLGQSFHGELIPTTGPVGISAARPGGGRPGWEHSSKLGYLVSPPQQIRREERSCYRSRNRGQGHSEPSWRRTQGPSLPATPVFVPVPPLPLNLPPPRLLPLPPGVPSPQFSPQFPPGQPPPAGYSVSSPGFPPAPANKSTPWVTSGVQTAHSHTIPTPQAPPLSREEFYRQQQRLEEESKLPYSGSSHSRSSCTYSKSRSGSTRSGSSSRSLRSSLSGSYSHSPPHPRRGRDKSRHYRSRSRSQRHHRSRSRSPPSYRYHSRSRSPPAFSRQSPTKGNVPQGEKECYSEWERKYREWYDNTMKGARGERSLDLQVKS